MIACARIVEMLMFWVVLTWPLTCHCVTVLVTNDDGVDAPGMNVLVQTLENIPEITEIYVVVPLEDQSGSGNRTSSERAWDVNDVETYAIQQSKIEAVAVPGYPSDAVRYALDILKLKPNITISGINRGANFGILACISGTVGAARTSALSGIPSIAVSQETPWSADVNTTSFEPSRKVIENFLQQNLNTILTNFSVESPVLFNINVPQVKKFRKPASKSTILVPSQIQTDIELPKAYISTARAPPNISDDTTGVANGYATITPISADFANMKCP